MDTMNKNTNKQFLSYAIVRLVILIALTIGATAHSRKHSSHGPTPAATLRTICSKTPYPDACVSSISKYPLSNKTTNPVTLFNLSLKAVVNELRSIYDLPKKLAETTNDKGIKSALGVCEHMIDNAVYCLEETTSVMKVGGGGKKKDIIDAKMIGYLASWLSAAIADYETCYDELYTESTISVTLKSAMRNCSEFTSNSVAIVVEVLAKLINYEVPWMQPTRGGSTKEGVAGAPAPY